MNLTGLEQLALGIVALAALVGVWWVRGWWDSKRPGKAVVAARAAEELATLAQDALAYAKKMQADPSEATAATILQATVAAHIASAEARLR